MTSASGSADTRTAALSGFDAAHDTFLVAFATAPDEALSYLPLGDDYTLGVLPAHLLDPMRKYLAIFEQMVATEFAPLDLSAEPHASSQARADAERHAYLVAQRPTSAERAPMLAELAREHQDVYERLLALDTVTFTRQAPVIYSAGSAPYPTSAQDILRWLADHYLEHATQVESMLAQWRATHL